MSVIIKSNNSAINYIANEKMVGTTAQAEFDKYKQRVLADGGEIIDEGRTLRAFNHLFNISLYGNMNTFVSGTFGVKKASNGRITRLYAVDGVDMQVDVRGSAPAPVLGADNAIDFGTNSWTDKENGALFSTVQPVKLSRVGSFAFGVTFGWGPNENRDTKGQIVAAVSSHEDLYNGVSGVIVDIKDGLGENSPTMDVRWASPSSDLESDNISQVSANVMNKYQKNPMMLAYVDNRVPERLGYRYGERGNVIREEWSKVFDVTAYSLYLDMGGVYNSTTHHYYTGKIIDFFSINHCTKEQAQTFTSF